MFIKKKPGMYPIQFFFCKIIGMWDKNMSRDFKNKKGYSIFRKFAENYKCKIVINNILSAASS